MKLIVGLHSLKMGKTLMMGIMLAGKEKTERFKKGFRTTKGDFYMSTQAIEKDSELKDLSHQVRAVTIEIRKMVEHANNVLVHFAAAEDKARSIEWDLEIHRSELAKVMSEIDSIKKLNQELRKEGQE